MGPRSLAAAGDEAACDRHVVTLEPCCCSSQCGAAWLKDSSGFFYSRYDEPKAGEKYTGANYYQKLYYHKLGDEQSQDKLIYERKDQKEWGFRGLVTEDGRYLVISVWRGTEVKNQVFYKRLETTVQGP